LCPSPAAIPTHAPEEPKGYGKMFGFCVNLTGIQCLSCENTFKEFILSQNTATERVQAAQCGDQAAYTQLIKDHYRSVFLTCLGVVGNPHDAEDLAQEVFITGLNRLGQLRDQAQFAAWIMQIARNHSINLLRSKRRLKMKAEQVRQLPVGQEATHYIEVERALLKMPQELREPLVMYYFDGQEVKKVAEVLNVSASNVYQRLRLAHKQLHSLLVRQGDVS
jgi:RNA polymerase sigma-70 factor (ECF subfamily)